MERRKLFVRDPRHIVVAHESDIDFFLWLDEFPFLHAWHLVELTGRNEKATYRRLNRLYHAEYIDRVRNPENYYAGPGSEPGYLVLDNKGARVLERARGIPYRDRRRRIENLKNPPHKEETRRRQVYNLHHDLLIPSTVAAFFRATRGTTMELLPKRALLEKLPMQLDERTRPFDWVVPVIHHDIPDVVGVHPDTVLALLYTTLPENRNRSFFFVECDTGSEDAYNSDLAVKSIYRMFLAYCGTQEHALAERFFGMRNFRVALLLPDAARLQEIIRMIDRHRIRQLPGFRHRMFVFNLHGSTKPDQDILTGWVDLNGEEVSFKR